MFLSECLLSLQHIILSKYGLRTQKLYEITNIIKKKKKVL